MKNMLIMWLAGAMIVLAMSVFCGQATSSGFSANIIERIEDTTVTGKIYVKGSKYRMEKEENGQQIVIIVNQETNVTKVLSVSRKACITMPCDDMKSLVNDPFQSLKYTAAKPDAVIKQLGPETVSGVECDKSTISYDGVELFTRWVSGKYEFPLKIVAHSMNDMTIELTKIEESAIDDTLFQVPEGYVVIGEDKPETPADSVETTEPQKTD